MNADRRGVFVAYAMITVAASGWGTWPLILRKATIAPALQSAVMMAVLTILSLPFMLRDRLAVKATRSQWLGIVWLGIGDALNVFFFFGAYAKTSVAVAVLTHYLTPIFVAVAAPILLRERSGPRTAASVGIASFGLLLLLQPWREGFAASDVVGALLGSASAVCYASNVLVNKRLVPAFSGSELMFFHGLVSTPILFAMVPASAIASADPRSVLVVAGGAVGPGALCGLLFVWGLRRVPASHASVLTLLEPFVAVVLAALVLGQTLSFMALIGGVLILGGALLVVTTATTKRVES